MHDTARETDVL